MTGHETAGTRLELRGIEVVFGTAAPVRALDGVDLTIESGEFLAISGRSGSGKSTMLNVLGLLEKPTSGSYIVNGRPTTQMRGGELDRLRSVTFGFVFQSFHLIEYLTVAENVSVGLTYSGLATRERDERINEVLGQVHLEHRATAKAATLSGGERQRVAIARTLARRPSVLLADEPTGNLDEATSTAVMDLFESLHTPGVTLVIVTHDEATAARAQRRVQVRDGRIDAGNRTHLAGRAANNTAGAPRAADEVAS